MLAFFKPEFRNLFSFENIIYRQKSKTQHNKNLILTLVKNI